MAVPDRAQAAALLHRFAPPAWLVAHSWATAEVAAFLRARLAANGVRLDGKLVEAAALLHDIDKTLADDHPLKRLGHGRAGAAWMRDNGYAELAGPLAHHPVTMLGEAGSYEAWAERAGLEGRVVAYADKRAQSNLVSLDERFADWFARHPGSTTLAVARQRAELLERELCALAGIAPDEVRRERWVADALRRPA